MITQSDIENTAKAASAGGGSLFNDLLGSVSAGLGNFFQFKTLNNAIDNGLVPGSVGSTQTQAPSTAQASFLNNQDSAMMYNIKIATLVVAGLALTLGFYNLAFRRA